MKNLIMVLVLIFIIASTSFALTNQTLIDFSTVGDQAAMQDPEADTNAISKLDDFYTDNWVVQLNSSADTVQNKTFSYVTNANSKGNNGNWADPSKVMGIRIHYPVEDWNSYGKVMPPYAMSIYGGNNGDIFTGGKGVIQNVQTIKSIKSWIYGRNFLVMYYINIADQDGVLTSYPMGYTYFLGWRELTWDNPNYVVNAEIRALKREPAYPRLTPSIRLDSMLFYRTKETIGGNFVTYVKNIDVEYEPAFVQLEEDIDDEATWGILKTEQERKRKIDEKRLLEIQELREIERLRLQQTGDNTGASDNTIQ